MGQPLSGIEESFFKQMRGRHYPRNFREHLLQKIGNGRGEGTTNVCAFTWRVYSDISAFLCHWMIFTFAEGKGKGFGSRK